MNQPLDDLSAYVRAGRITTAADVLDDAVEAERLGFRRVFLSERYDLKEAGALLGGMAARTSRIGLATGALIPSSRPPVLTAALGATMHSAYGPRFVLGLGRSTGPYLENAGIDPVTFRGLVGYADTVKRLWAGEVVGSLHLADTYDGPAPEIWSVNLGGPKACRAAAQPVFDGVLLAPFLTVEAVGRTVARLREECERIDRDPDSLHVCHPLVTAPGADDTEVRQQLHARMVTYLQEPGIGENYARLNEWDFEPIRKVREHPQFQTGMVNASADHNFHRKDLLGPAELVPDEWMTSTCATGTPDECVALLRRYKDAGVRELSTYGSTPGQNVGLVEAWRAQTVAA